MLVIFDIDGTICDTQSAEDGCYARAVLEILGIELEDFEWGAFPEPTSSGILATLLEGDPDLPLKEQRVKERFVELLREARPVYPGDFSPIAGAAEFLELLRGADGIDVAIATGGFDEEARFKLDCCGIRLDDFPHATASDAPARRTILPLAVRRAGFRMSDCVYFGDALWDIRVSRELEIPLIGIGRKGGIFEEQGVTPHFRDFADPSSILEELRRFGRGSNS
jgi:beta-phosphoglucomutase-like phosphatase (HAD superfamily)